MFCDILKDKIAEIFYRATLSGYYYSIDAESLPTGLVLRIGTSHEMVTDFSEIFAQFGYEIKPDIFEMYKDQHLRNISNEMIESKKFAEWVCDVQCHEYNTKVILVNGMLFQVAL